MPADLKKISKDLIIFSVLISDFEKADFKNDALAGVRANYFNSDMKPQKDRTNLSFDGRNYLLSYNLSKGEPISWKISAENVPFQSVKRDSDDVYCIISYKDGGAVYKRQYFDLEHNWLRTEYFEDNNSAYARLSHIESDGVIILKYEFSKSDGSFGVKYLFPSLTAPKGNSTGLAYTNLGMLWFDESFKPDNFVLPKEAPHTDGFGFTKEDFCNIDSKPIAVDLSNAEFLSDEDINLAEDNTQDDNAQEDKPYSAYDKIGEILFEASKSNKDLFGEVISCFDDEDDAYICTDKGESQSVSSDGEPSSESISEEIQPDTVIKNKSGKYKYYGSLDSNGLRTGRGRTVTPEGFTSYDGDYYCGKRNGFGVCYYNEGKVNYIGNWDMGVRSGSGVGYRLSDGTMHAGKWNTNTPESYGARFDSDGDFIDVCLYADGTRNGKSVSFDDEGRLVVRLWENGELTAEKILSNGDIFGEQD